MNSLILTIFFNNERNCDSNNIRSLTFKSATLLHLANAVLLEALMLGSKSQFIVTSDYAFRFYYFLEILTETV